MVLQDQFSDVMCGSIKEFIRMTNFVDNRDDYQPHGSGHVAQQANSHEYLCKENGLPQAVLMGGTAVLVVATYGAVVKSLQKG